MHYFLPQRTCIDFFAHHGIVAVDGVLLDVGLSLCSTAHELIVNLHAHIGTGHLSLRHLCVYKRFGIRVLDADRQHEGAPAAILCHFPCAVAETLHKRNQTRRGQCRILDR